MDLGHRSGDLWTIADGWKMTTAAKLADYDEAGVAAPLAELRQIADRLGSRFFLAWYHAMVGYFARNRGDFQLARTALDASAECCERVGDPSTGGFAQAWLGGLDADVGEFDGAMQRLDLLLSRAAATGSDLAAPEALFIRGRLALGHGDPETALAISTGFVEAFRDTGVPTWVAQTLVVIAGAHRMRADLPAAKAALDEATATAEPYGNVFVDGLIGTERARLLLADNDPPAAEELLVEVLTRQLAAGLRPGVTHTLEALGACALAAESPLEAARCYGAATALRTSIGYAVMPTEATEVEIALTACREHLGDDELNAQFANAGTVPIEEVAEWLARARGQRRRPSSGWASLTPTELRVAALVAEGLTNPQIAERMFISRGTAKVHVSHIFDKLSFKTRSQLAVEVTARNNDTRRAN